VPPVCFFVPANYISSYLPASALVPSNVRRPTEPDFWTLPLEKVMILSRGTSFSAEDHHDIDTHALYGLWV
jgi:hypothetical protein